MSLFEPTIVLGLGYTQLLFCNCYAENTMFNIVFFFFFLSFGPTSLLSLYEFFANYLEDQIIYHLTNGTSQFKLIFRSVTAGKLDPWIQKGPF